MDLTCFSIGFVKQPNRVSRRGYKTGYQVGHEFAVTQGARNIAALAELKEGQAVSVEATEDASGVLSATSVKLAEAKEEMAAPVAPEPATEPAAKL